MANGQVMNLTMFTIDEIQAEGIARVYLDTGVSGTLDDEFLEVDQCQLTAVRLALADDKGTLSDELLCIRRPAATLHMRKQALILEHARQIQVHVLTNDNRTVRTECSQELVFVGNGLRHLTTDAILVGHRLLALDELDVELFDDMELNGTIIVAGLIPGLTTKIVL